MIRSQRTFLACLVGGQLFLAGCGGTSQDDMRRHAIRRTPDDEVAIETKPELDKGRSSTAQPGAAVSTRADAAPERTSEVAASGTAARKPSPHALTPTAETGSDTNANTDVAATRSEAIPSVTPPAEPLSPAERRERTAANLTRIGEAWRSYLSAKRVFPGPITGDARQPLLSWRVELLPYLDLQPLYDAFHLDEAWDSPHNIALLDKVPEVFQSPERFDTNTNYLALSQGASTVYQERRQISESKVEDGIENTLALVEVDDQHAVPWTRPAEYPLQVGSPLESLTLRGNGLFVVWSDGKASWIDGKVDPTLFAKACTIDSGDGFRGSQIASELAAGIAVPLAPSSEATPADTIAERPDAVKPEHNVVDSVPATSGAKTPTLGDAHAALKSQSESRPQPSWKREPIPSARELKIARDLLRELYQADYSVAKTEPQRVQLARKMLDRMPDLRGDVAGQYAVLEIAKQIAVQAGDVDVAMDAAEQMTARFELQGDLLLETIEKLARTAKDRRAHDRLIEEAEDLFNDFISAEKFAAAERLSQLAVAAASKVNNEAAVDKFTARRNWASEAKDLHKSVEESLAVLEQNPGDPRANGDVGKFLCLIKEDWDNGLVILANGHDRSLKRLAEMELGDMSDAMRQLELADLWWREAESKSPGFKATLQSRAKYWYEQSLPGLPPGLVRLRVERRVEEIDKPSA